MRTPTIFVERGQRVGRGVVIDSDVRLPRAGRPNGNGARGARLLCDCGNVYETLIANLIERRGRINTTSCGCARRDAVMPSLTARNRAASEQAAARAAERKEARRQREAAERHRQRMLRQATLTENNARLQAESGIRWLPVPGWEELYAVSDQGDVQSLRTGKLMVPVKHRKGYLTVRLSLNGYSKTRKVHILVAEAFIGPCPEGQQVRHWDGVKTYNAAANLLYGTPSENMLDQVRQGMHYEASRTYCDNGHEFTPENTRLDARGHRHCRTCRRRIAAASRKRRRSAA